MRKRFAARHMARIAVALTLCLPFVASRADPPGRVGRISFVQAPATTQLEADDIRPAELNWPISTGSMLATGPDGLAEVRIGSIAIRVDRSSEFVVDALDDTRVLLQVPRGSIGISIGQREVAAEIVVQTPIGRALFDEAGQYRVAVGPEGTMISAFRGTSRFATASGELIIAAGRRADVFAADGSSYRVIAAMPDPFDQWALGRDAAYEPRQSAAYVSTDMTGAEVLDQYGDWRNVPEYGMVWMPRTVPVGWAPYRMGRWTWVAPWGWTWIDEAPWGFAPAHYGRWAYHGNNWCWVPGLRVARPVYAPAVVGWFGAPGTRASSGYGAPTVGWFPLAPREAFHPGYATSPHYFRRINHGHADDAPTTFADARRHYRHADAPHAVSFVPAAVIAAGKPVSSARIAMNDPRAWQGHAIANHAPIAAPPRPVRQEIMRPAPSVVVIPPNNTAPSGPSLSSVPHPPGAGVIERGIRPRIDAPVQSQKPPQIGTAPVPAPVAPVNPATTIPNDRSRREHHQETRRDHVERHLPPPVIAPPPVHHERHAIAPSAPIAPAPTIAPAPRVEHRGPIAMPAPVRIEPPRPPQPVEPRRRGPHEK